MDAMSAVLDRKEYMVNLRRTIHRNPELGWEEYETQKLVMQELQRMGIPCEAVCETGVVGVIQGGKPGPVTGLRADMDALPVLEKSGAEYASTKAGKMHACGHDCHVAMLLTAAAILKEHQAELCGTVKLVFQPAEEIVEGGEKMVQLPQLQDLEQIVALHVWMDMEVGTVSVEPGPRMASSDIIRLRIVGKSAHGAQPHQSADAIVAACAVVGQLQTAVSRRVNPLDPVVVTIGTIHGGTGHNIIAGEVELTGTVRYFNPALRDKLPEVVRNLACKTAEACGTECEVEYRHCVPAVINAEEITSRVAASARKVLGEGSLAHMEKSMASEDFACYQQRVPGCFLFVGCRNDAQGKRYPQHHECFDVDEDALVNGAALLVQFALDAGAC